MNLKTKTLLLFIASVILSAGVIALLAVAYLNFFPAWSTLCLLISVVVTIFGWAFFYITRQKYLDESDPKRAHNKGKGNRKNRRKG